MSFCLDDAEVLLLAKAHDRYIAVRKGSASDRLIPSDDCGLAPEVAERSFSKLVSEGLVASSGSQQGGSAGQNQLFMATPKGESCLRGVARDKALQVELTEFEPIEQSTHLVWNAPSLVPEYAQWRVLGEVRDGDGRLLHSSAAVAEVSFFHIGSAVLKASGHSIHSVFDETEMTLRGNPAEDEDGMPLDLDELPTALGLPDSTATSILVIAEIRVFSSYLGAGLGAGVIQKLAQRVTPGGGIAMLSPYPLSHMAGPLEINGNISDDAFSVGLRNYYQGLGFIDHPRLDGVMIGDLGVLRFCA